MNENLAVPSGHIGTGSALLLTDEVILAAAAVRTSAIIGTSMVSTLGIDVSADQDCTVVIVRVPDGETDGVRSTIGTVIAGEPAFFLYSSLLCPAVRVVVENIGGAPMTEFAMYVRGGA